MRRLFVFSFVFATVAACAMLTAPQASARSLGSFSINTTGPITPTPFDPWGGVQLCTAHLRKLVGSTWQYHTASGYDYSTCAADAQPYVNNGYTTNPHPNFGFCQCHSGFNGLIVAGPSGNGPLDVHNLTQEQVQMYDEGLAQLRQKYQIDRFAEELELLLQSIEAIPSESDGH